MGWQSTVTPCTSSRERCGHVSPGAGDQVPVPTILFLAGVGRSRAAVAAMPLSGASAPLPAPAASTRWVRRGRAGDRAGDRARTGPAVPAVTPHRSRTVRQRGGHGGDTGTDTGAERGHDVEQAPHGRRYPPPRGHGDDGDTPRCHRADGGTASTPSPLLSSQGTAAVRTRGWAASWRTQGGCPLGVALPHPLPHLVSPPRVLPGSGCLAVPPGRV